MTAMNTYLQQVQRLVRDVKMQILNPQDLLVFVNEARIRISAEAECIRAVGTLAVTSANAGPYAFSSIVIPSASALGIKGVLNVRLGSVTVGSAPQTVVPRSYEWYWLYSANNPTLGTGAPTEFAQYAQGASGTLYVSPTPDASYSIRFDTVCLPVDIVDNSTVEAVPLIWTYAIPYYAAYLAMLSVETGENSAEADKMFQRYQNFATLARQGATPSVLSWQAQQVPTPGGVTGSGAR